MSHITTVKAEIRDLEALKRACSRLGWKFCENQKTYAWYGRGWQDDSPVPKHLFSEEEYQNIQGMSRPDRINFMNSVLGKCDHAIQVPGINHYEIGLIRKGDSYLPIWDAWCNALDHAVGKEGGTLAQAYAIEKTKMIAASQGHFWTESQRDDGSVELKIRVGE